MKNYLVVTDTTSAMNKEIAKETGIVLVSLSIINEGKEYKDQEDITSEQLYEILENDGIPTTSQPNTGYIMELMEEWKKENYDAIIIVTCSSDLSGTNNGFHLAGESVGLDNLYIFDSRQVGAPVMDMAICAKEMAERDCDIEDILSTLEEKRDHSFSFLYPENFKQLSRGGRLSPVAARMASLFKIKALLYLEESGKTVDKYAMTRTETKLFKEVVDKFKENGVNRKNYKLYVSHANNLHGAKKVKLLLEAAFLGIRCEITELPAVLCCHGGLGCLAIHYTLIK